MFPTSSRPALGSTQPHTKWIPEYHFLGVRKQMREADHSAPVVELYIHSSVRLRGMVLNQLSAGTTLAFNIKQKAHFTYCSY
jgi:hypothetical protein